MLDVNALVGFVAGLGLVALGFGIVTFICCCVDYTVEDHEIINAKDASIPVQIALVIRRIGRAIMPIKALRWVVEMQDYILNRPNPVFQIFYLAIMVGCYGEFVIHGFQYMPCSTLSSWHQMTSFITVAFCLYSFYEACRTPPTRVTAKNAAMLCKEYPYDGLMFLTNHLCKTCNVLKPARSKHCRICGFCVARYDHHCVWVNQCVGRKNYGWFIVFLSSHVVMCLYGAYLLGSMIAHVFLANKLLEATFVDNLGNKHAATWSIIVQYLLHKHFVIVGLFCLAAVMYLALGGFTLYHFWLIFNNRTTNESTKLSDWESRLEHLTEAAQDETTNGEDAMMPAAAVSESELKNGDKTGRLQRRRKKGKAPAAERSAQEDSVIELSEATLARSRGIYRKGAWANLMEAWS